MSPDLLRRTEMKSKSGAQCGSAPRDPPRNGQAGSDSRQRCCAQRRKFLYSGQDVFVRRAARYDSAFAFPSEGKVPEGRMRCRLRVAEPFTGEKVTLCSVTRFALHLIRRLRRHLPLKGEGYSVRGRMFNSPRSDLSALCGLY